MSACRIDQHYSILFRGTATYFPERGRRPVAGDPADQAENEPCSPDPFAAFIHQIIAIINNKSSSARENWNALIGSISEFERDPRQLNLDSLKWTDGSQWSRSAYRMLVGIVRNHTLLQYLLSQYAARPPKATLKGFLLLGIYQLLEARDDAARLPKVVHHTVDLIRKNCSEREGKFANAVLRKIAGSIHEHLEQLETQRKWDVRYSHPQWLIERWTGFYEEADTLALLQWNQQVPRLYAQDFSGYLETPEGKPVAESFDLAATVWPGFYEISKGGREMIHRLLELPLYIQDPSTAIAPGLFGESLKGDILDACAAPGGKTLLLHKQLAEPDATIHAVDRDEHRIRLIEDNLKRLSLTQVKTHVCDWGTTARPADLPSTFDYALVDAPCSSVGIIQKHPEIRWRLTPSDYEVLPTEQLRILEAVAQTVKPGGKLVYSTCSIDPAENTEVIKTFLATETGSKYRLERELVSLPHQSQHDGVGAALFHRIG